MLREIMEGGASEAETAGFLIALRTKGETVEEIAGLARDHARAGPARGGRRRPGRHRRAPAAGGPPSTCPPPRRSWPPAPAAGWPSTATAPPRASAARPTCSRRSARGSTSSPATWPRCIGAVGFGFMFAPLHHSAMRHVVPVRKALGVRTIFNFLGPLTNPAGARRQVIGVSDPAKLETMAAALGELGTERALVVSSADGLDEFSVSGATRVVELKDRRLATYDVTPRGGRARAGGRRRGGRRHARRERASAARRARGRAGHGALAGGAERRAPRSTWAAGPSR